MTLSTVISTAPPITYTLLFVRPKQSLWVKICPNLVEFFCLLKKKMNMAQWCVFFWTKVARKFFFFFFEFEMSEPIKILIYLLVSLRFNDDLFSPLRTSILKERERN